MSVTTCRTVVFVESASAMAGVQFSTLYVAKALDQSRWRPIIVTPNQGDLNDACRQASIEAHVLRYPRLWSTSVRVGRRYRLPNPFAWVWDALVTFQAVRRLRSFLETVSPAVIVTKGLSSHFIGGLAARKLGIPCVWHAQDFISERTVGIYRRIFGLAARALPHQVIADGATIKRQLPSSMHAIVCVIHNGVDTNEFRPGLDGTKVREELGIRRDHLVIGHAGRITPWKGQHYVIEAFARIASDYPKVTLLFAGSPVFDHYLYERRLRTMAAAFGLSDRVKFAGYRRDLPDVLAAMDIFAFTSVEKDTSPLALLSAMSSGLPIVAFDIEGVRELVKSDKLLLLVPTGDTDSLTQSLRLLISDEQLRQRLADNARRAAETKFNLELYVNRIDEVLLNACSRKPTERLAEDLRPSASSPGNASTSTVSIIGS
jgi:glycosyltransferase involved in cell wall biosynthesis